MTTRPHRLIVEQIDPNNLAPGGIETCIHDLFKYGDEVDFSLVGVTNDPQRWPLGQWHDVEVSGRKIRFLPVMTLDRTVHTRRLPHSLLLSFATFANRKSLPSGPVQAHRLELGAFARLALRRNLIQFLHTDSVANTSEQSDSIWRRVRFLYRAVERAVLPGAKSIVLFNATDVARLRTIAPNVIQRRTWYDEETFAILPDEKVAATQKGRVLWVGRFEEQKNPLMIIQVLAEIASISDDFHLVLVGDGSQRGDMESLARRLGVYERITFAGRLTRKEVAQEMAQAEVMVMTSYYEGSSRALIEAGAMGLPVVATPGSDPDYSLTPGINGIRVDDSSVSAVAQALLVASAAAPQSCQEAVRGLGARESVRNLLRQTSA